MIFTEKYGYGWSTMAKRILISLYKTLASLKRSKPLKFPPKKIEKLEKQV